MTPVRNNLPRRNEGGFTLVEVVVAVSILGLGVVALLGGLAMSVFGSGLHRNQADLDAALVNAVEAIKAQPYQACLGSNPTGIPYTNSPGYAEVAIGSGNYSPFGNPSPVPSPGTGYFVVSIQYWNGSGWMTITASSGCLPAVPPNDQELITITGFSPDHLANQTVSLVKANR